MPCVRACELNILRFCWIVRNKKKRWHSKKLLEITRGEEWKGGEWGGGGSRERVTLASEGAYSHQIHVLETISRTDHLKGNIVLLDISEKPSVRPQRPFPSPASRVAPTRHLTLALGYSLFLFFMVSVFFFNIRRTLTASIVVCFLPCVVVCCCVACFLLDFWGYCDRFFFCFQNPDALLCIVAWPSFFVSSVCDIFSVSTCFCVFFWSAIFSAFLTGC